MIRAARSPTETWASARADVIRFNRFDRADQVPTGECSRTTTRWPGMVSAAARAH